LNDGISRPLMLNNIGSFGSGKEDISVDELFIFRELIGDILPGKFSYTGTKVRTLRLNESQNVFT